MPNPKHSLETLTVTAAFSWCMTDCLHNLGAQNTPRIRRNLWKRLRSSGIDTSHWDTSPRRWYSDESLSAAVHASVSIAATLRALGVPVTGGQHAHLARRIRRAGLDTSHFLGQAHNRGRAAPRRNPAEVLVLLPNGSDRPRTTSLRSAMERSGIERRCAICDCEPRWRGRTSS